MTEKIIPVSESCLKNCAYLDSVIELHKLFDEELVQISIPQADSEAYRKSVSKASLNADFKSIVNNGYNDPTDLKQSEELDRPNDRSFPEGLKKFAKETAVHVVFADTDDKEQILDELFQDLYDKAIGKIACSNPIIYEDEIMIPFCKLREFILQNYEQ